MLAVPPLRGRNPAPFRPRLPGSKSGTCRALILAAMRPGTTAIPGGLRCEDTDRLAAALSAFGGLAVEPLDEGFTVWRGPGPLRAPDRPLDLGAGGAPARFLLAFAAAAEGVTEITGNERLRQRPMQDLLAALRHLGVPCDCPRAEGHLPVRVHGRPRALPGTRTWPVGAATSSQFTSALLLLASQLPGGPIEIRATGARASEGHVDLTLAMLARCGIRTERPAPDRIVVHPATPAPAEIAVEPDASALSYFLAMAAVTGTGVAVAGLGRRSHQRDVAFADVLAEMGCEVAVADDTVALQGRSLRGIETDLADMPDTAPTLAALAAHARGPTRITGLATLRHKECDRIAACAAELRRLGQRAGEGADWLAVEPRGAVRPARVRTYGDHRMAMAFAVLGLAHGGLAVDDPDCVAKSFPGFWRELGRFRAHHEAGGA